MNKEKILESSRRENKNRDLAEMEVTAQAGNIAGRVGGAFQAESGHQHGKA